MRNYRYRRFDPSDAPSVCGCVRSRERLQRISGDCGDSLTPDILHRWSSDARAAIVVHLVHDQTAAGFCTLSRQEVAGLPDAAIEICHFVVSPAWQFRGLGSFLFYSARALAWHLGYRSLLGRIVPSNLPALTLATSLSGQEIAANEMSLPSSFRWFRWSLTSDCLRWEFYHATCAERSQGDRFV